MTTDLVSMSREAGRSGRSWNDFTFSDEVQALIETAGDLDTNSMEAAYTEGLREHRIANGWIVAWTTAPADYDWFGTETLEECGDWKGKKLRRVLIAPNEWDGQTGRYWSGLHGSWTEDPREVDARVAREAAERKAADEAREAKRQEGLTWLRSLSNEQLEAVDFDAFEPRGVRYDDVKLERSRRAAAAAEKTRISELTRCLNLVHEGDTLIDDGESPKRSQYGNIPGRDPHVYYNVSVARSWKDDVDHNNVYGSTARSAHGEHIGSLAYVADWIASGRLRVATPEDQVPPQPVLERIGHEQRKEIRRVEVGGRVVWVGRPRFGSDVLVLDERGHLVRGKALVQTAVMIATSQEAT